MGLLNKLATSADLMQGMAKRMGVDPAEAIERSPDVEAEKFRSAVIRCSFCAEQGACMLLQAEHDSLIEPPEYCQNRKMILARKAAL